MTRVLIIDDDDDIVEPLSILFSENGYEVSFETKGDLTEKKVKEFQPHVILLDILMSGSDGRIICQQLKQHARYKHIPIIMMSAHPTVAKDAKQSLADAFIAKPFSAKDVLTIVKQFVS